MIARSAPSPSSPAPSARRYAALGPDRSARPSKRSNHAANAYLTVLSRTEDKRSSDSVRRVEYWFPQLRHRQTKEAATDMFDLKLPRHTSTLPFSTFWTHSELFWSTPITGHSISISNTSESCQEATSGNSQGRTTCRHRRADYR